MTWLDRRLRQRIVGALVLVSLAATFLPMLLDREDERRHVRVEAPPKPAMPPMPTASVQDPVVPEAAPVAPAPAKPEPPKAPVAVAPPPPPPPKAAAAPPAPAKATTPEPRLDASGLPISWSIQLASLSNRASAEALVQKLRSGGYNAYVRTVSGMNRVFVGPVVERSEANRLRDQLQQQQKLDGFVVRFQPERE